MNIRRSPNDKKLSPIKKKTKQKTYLNLVEFPLSPCLLLAHLLLSDLSLKGSF